MIVGERTEGYRFFELDRLTAALELTGRVSRAERQLGTGPALTDTDRIFQEAVDLGMRGFFGHRNLLDVEGTFRLGLEQRDTESDVVGLSQSEDNTLALYDVSGLILGATRLPVTVFSRRDQNFFDREFAGSVENRVEEHGVELQYRSDFAPTSVRVFRRIQDQDDQLGLSDYRVVQDSANVQSDLRLADNQNLRLEYTFDDVSEAQGAFANLEYDRHDGTLTHELRFGDDERHNLRSIGRIFDQHGDVNQRTLMWDEQLFLQHTDRLSTRYALNVQDQEINGTTQRVYRGNAQVRHRLFESLYSTASVGGGRTELPDDHFTSDEWNVRATFDYTKRVPLGRLDAGLGLAFNREDNTERGEIIPIVDDAGVITDPFPLTIRRRNVVPGSIVVTDAAGLRTYVEGIDYTVQVFPDRVEISRVIGGAISNGETLLVDYDLGPEPASIIDATTAAASFRYGLTEGPLAGLAAYASYQQIDYRLESPDPTAFVLDDARRLKYGIEYVWRGVTLLTERETYDSEVAPYDLWRAQARYSRRLGISSVLNLSTSYERIDYDVPDNHVELTRVTAEWVQRITDATTIRLWANFRDENDRVSPDTTGFEQALEVRWHRRQTDVFATVSNSQVESANEDNQFLALTVGIRRAF